MLRGHDARAKQAWDASGPFDRRTSCGVRRGLCAFITSRFESCTAPFVIAMVDAPKTPEEAHAPAMARGATCRACPLWGCQRGPVLGQIRQHSSLIVIGEAPGNNEVEVGAPFVGASGRVLDESLMVGGLRREEVSVTNVLLCQPPLDFETYIEKLRHQHKRDGGLGEALLPTTCCAPRLARDLSEAASIVELAVGNKALQSVANHHGVAFGKTKAEDVGQIRVAHLRKQHGAPIVLRDEPRKVLVASYHPAFAFRGAKAWMPVIKKTITRAALIARRHGQIDWAKPNYNVNPSFDEIQKFADLALRHNALVTVDIETDGAHTRTCRVRCVGMGMTLDGVEHVIVVPLRNMDGTMVWSSREELVQVGLQLRRVMDDCPLAFQNGAFDTSVMLRVGLMTAARKTYFDTMLAHHDTDSNDLPHDLGFILSEHFEAPHHKDDADHKVVDNVGYERLKIYNADDVLGTMRLVDPLWQRIVDLGTYAQFETDTKLAPICRDMGDLGLVIDERERSRLAVALHEKCEFHEAQFRFMAACISGPEEEADKVRVHLATLGQDRSISVADRQQRTLDVYRAFAERHGLHVLNPRSPPQLKTWLFEREGLTPQLNTDGFDYDHENDDSPSTSTAALLKLQDKYPHIGDAVDALLEYRAYAKLYGTYVADKAGNIRDVDWTQWGLPDTPWARILNTIYKLHIIPSGRLSTQPAIQNWPAVGKANMRTMVVSPPGHCIVGADYDQLELRIYATVAQDRLLLQAFQEGLDPHSLNAAALLCDHESQVMDVYKRIVNAEPKEKKYWRTVAKRFAFLECYGGEEDKLFATMAASRNKATGKRDFPDLTMEEVMEWHARWHKLHPETYIWQKKFRQFAYNYGFVSVGVLDYRKRYFPGGIDKKNAPVNHTIQGFAASIANRALIQLTEAIPHRGWTPASGPFLQVHDYIGVYVPRERAYEAKRIMEECMYFEYGGLPFTCTAEVSNRWSDQG